jgi:hypothetical protein
MMFYYLFPIVAFVIALGVDIICSRMGRRFFVWWILASVVLGAAALFVPWQTSSLSQRGSGSPIPAVIWERIESGAYIDFPVPIAVILDPGAVYLIGMLAWGTIQIWRLIFRSRHDDQAIHVA